MCTLPFFRVINESVLRLGIIDLKMHPTVLDDQYLRKDSKKKMWHYSFDKLDR